MEQNERIEAWRRDVAKLAAPVVVRFDNRGFHRGLPAPVQVHVDDGLEIRQAPSVGYTRTVSSRHERPASEQAYSIRHTSRRSGSGTAHSATRRSSLQPRHRVEYQYETPAPATAPAPPPAPPPASRVMSLSKPSRNSSSTGHSPVTRLEPVQEPEAEVVVYTTRSRARAPHPSRKEVVVERTSSRRRKPREESYDWDYDPALEKRMRLLEIRDRMRDEVERAREWTAARPRPPRVEYHRRSLHY